MAKRDGVLDFAIGKHQPEPPAELLELIRDQPNLAVRRSGPKDLGELAEQAVEMLAREYNVQVTPECVLLVPSGRAAISALVSCLLTPGDGVLVTEPGYPVFARLAAQHHGRGISVSLNPDRDFAPDLDALAADASTIRIAALNYPNNPTGTMLSADTVTRLGEMLPDNAILFNDATYGPLAYDDPPRSLLDAEFGDSIEQPTVELHSLSKLFGLSGLPVSFLVGTEALIKTLREYCDFAFAPASELQVRIATRCVSNTNHLSSMRKQFADRVQTLRATLTELGFDLYPTPAGLYVLSRTAPGIGGRPVTGPRDAAEELLNTFGVAVMPWEAPPNGYLRFSSLYRPEDLDALTKLATDRPLVTTRGSTAAR
ncbi:MAG: pyridoxal phosphate-dependent aminotransferase [Planctomycetota bacterium]